MIGRPGGRGPRRQRELDLARPRLRTSLAPAGWLALAAAPFLIGAGLLIDTSANASDEAGRDKGRTGEQIYRQMCASCHGAAGEGTDDHYPRPLIGERPVASLAKLIARTMPEDEPGTCVGPDADRVASYIYEAFYSKAAQARNPMRPARIELSRLTVRQYRNALADLIARPDNAPRWDDRRGLNGQYTRAGRRRRGGAGGNADGFNRLDPEIRFHFGENSPIPAQNAVKEQSRHYVPLPALPVPVDLFGSFSQEFRINWQGSLLAPDTGEYEFVVRTENAVRLWVNDNDRPLIDISVKSGSDTEYRETIHLLGGRVYPIRLEVSKGKEKTASIELLWKVPRRGLGPIPSRNLSPVD
ncbi:MAG: PA14 domain-containing protein, partial [Isosphaeraceae bacterium]